MVIQRIQFMTRLTHVKGLSCFEYCIHFYFIDIKGTGTAYGWGHERIKGLESIRRYKLNKGVAVQLSTVLQKIDLQ